MYNRDDATDAAPLVGKPALYADEAQRGSLYAPVRSSSLTGNSLAPARALLTPQRTATSKETQCALDNCQNERQGRCHWELSELFGIRTRRGGCNRLICRQHRFNTHLLPHHDPHFDGDFNLNQMVCLECQGQLHTDVKRTRRMARLALLGLCIGLTILTILITIICTI